MSSFVHHHTVKATDIRVGDRIRARSGVELSVTRIDEGFLGRTGMLAFVEDSDEKWFQYWSAPIDGDVEVVSRADSNG